MVTASETKAQVRITNVSFKSDGSFVPKVLSIKASKLKQYIDMCINECNGKYTPNYSKKFESLPLLCLWDLADTKEQIFFNTESDLPTKTVCSSSGQPMLIIIPETDTVTLGLNQTRHLSKKALARHIEVTAGRA